MACWQYHPRRMSVVAITGASGYLGGRIISRFARDDAVSKIIAIDRDPPKAGPKVSPIGMDIRDPGLAGAIGGADLLFHLAFVHDQIADLDEMSSVNIGGTANLIAAVAAEGIQRVVYPSSAMVYGAHEDNRCPLPEDAPLRTNVDCVYAMHKARTEELFGDLRARATGVRLAILRSAIVLGPSVENFVSRTFQAPRLFSVRGFHPAFQCTHEEDVASALAYAGAHGLDGTFNVASAGSMTTEEVAAIAGKRRLDLPPGVAMAMADRLWKAGLAGTPPSELRFFMYPWVVDTSALARAGWEPKYTGQQALEEMIEASGSYIAIGRARVRKGSVVKGAAATLGALGALAVVRKRRAGAS